MLQGWIVDAYIELIEEFPKNINTGDSDEK